MPLPDDFATTGFCATRAGDTPITRFQVLGERSSGTNFVKRLLGRNSALKPVEVLGWKHGFTHMMAVPQDMGVICVVRDPLAWTLSMFDKPWHTTPQMQALPFSDFIRARWDTIIDRPRYFDGLVPDGSTGAPLQMDRDPLTGQPFDTLFALRSAKLRSLLTLLERDCTCVMLRMETAQADPEGTVTRLARTFGTAPAQNHRPVVKRLGSKFKPAIAHRPAKSATWSEADLNFARDQLDLTLESALGYDP
ncbi:MAG: hypothetical protein AAFY39_20025 [Pseudomonadota bacterium]